MREIKFDDYRNPDNSMDWRGYYAAVSRRNKAMELSHRKRVTEAFDKWGIVKVEVSFSGGNDEGGADSMTFYIGGEDGPTPIDNSKFKYSYTHHRDSETGKWGTRELTPEQKEINAFLDMLEEPIQRQWGSFAGEFYVDGDLVYDLSDPAAEKYMHMTYDESLYESHHHEMEA